MKSLFTFNPGYFIALLLLTSGCAEKRKDTPHSSKPNIIFIMADDLGYGDLGCYGQRVIQTPHIDRMAKEGMRFTQCYAGSTVCAPSRSVLMTGKHTGHTTVRGNNGVGGVVGLGGAAGRIPLLEQDTTVAEILKSAGYATGIAGKWALGEPGTDGLPNKQGFDEFFGFLNQRRAHSYYPDYIWQDTTRVYLEGNQDGGRKTYVHDLFTNYALDFIQRHKNEPFFLYLPYTLPHDTYEIPELGVYADSSEWREEERIFAAMVTRLDRDIGQILKLLDELALDSNTIVFFCSDNGPAQFWKGRFDSSGGFRGRKRDLYEGGIRVPMIVRFPGKIPAGTENDFPWYFADVLPTLADLGGAARPTSIDGINVLPELGISTAHWKRPQRGLYWEFYETGYQQAVRWKNWKGLHLSADETWELYDLESDPQENKNLAGIYPDTVAMLIAIAKKEYTPSPFFPKK